MLVLAGVDDGPSMSYADAVQQSGTCLDTHQLPTITTRGGLALSTGSSSSRSRSDPLGSEPSTPTHPPTFQNLHHFQVHALAV